MQQRLAETGRVRVGIGGFLVLTHLLAGAVAVAVASQAQTRSTVSWVFVALALVAACATGWLLTIELRRNFHLVELALQRLANGQPIAEIPPGPRWPLTKLTALVNVLGARERQYGALRQQMLTHSEQAAVQEERNRLARDLHDSIKQQLFSINVQAAAAQARWEHDPHAAQRAIADVRRSAHEAMVEMRALLQQLRPAPLETVGLMEALRDQAEALGYRSGARVVTRFGELPSDDHLPPGTQDAIFRIAQEALSNVARHARADHVELHLELHDDALLLLVRDDGQGFDPQCASGGMGLGNMRERAQLIGGTITMESMPGSGTVLTVRVPLVQPVVQEDSMNAETKALVQQAGLWRGGAVLPLGFACAILASMGRYSVVGVGRPLWLACAVVIGTCCVVAALCIRPARRIERRLTASSTAPTFGVLQLRSVWHITRGFVYMVGFFLLPHVPLHYPAWQFTPLPANPADGSLGGVAVEQAPVDAALALTTTTHQSIAAALAVVLGGLCVVELVAGMRLQAQAETHLAARHLREHKRERMRAFKINLLTQPIVIASIGFQLPPSWHDISFPPVSIDSWMATSLFAMWVGLVVLQIWSFRTYLQARRLLHHEVCV